jgi:DNA gyrase subunit A
MATKNGVVKKTPIQDFANVRRTGIIAITLKKGDLLKWVLPSSGKDEVLLATEGGQAIRFKESQLRPMGRAAAGVRGIRLRKNDFLCGMDIIKEGSAAKKPTVLVMMGKGFAKQTSLSEYKVQSRGGQGIKTAKIVSKTGPVVAVKIIGNEEDVLVLSAKGQMIKTKLADIRRSGRATSGVRVMRLSNTDTIAATLCL